MGNVKFRCGQNNQPSYFVYKSFIRTHISRAIVVRREGSQFFPLNNVLLTWRGRSSKVTFVYTNVSDGKSSLFSKLWESSLDVLQILQKVLHNHGFITQHCSRIIVYIKNVLSLWRKNMFYNEQLPGIINLLMLY